MAQRTAARPCFLAARQWAEEGVICMPLEEPGVIQLTSIPWTCSMMTGMAEIAGGSEGGSTANASKAVAAVGEMVLLLHGWLGYQRKKMSRAMTKEGGWLENAGGEGSQAVLGLRTCQYVEGSRTEACKVVLGALVP